VSIHWTNGPLQSGGDCFASAYRCRKENSASKARFPSEFCYKKGMAPDVVMNQICNNIIELLFSDYAIWLLTLLQKVKFNFCDEHD
jgi:hypothetical protein